MARKRPFGHGSKASVLTASGFVIFSKVTTPLVLEPYAAG